MLQFGTNYMKLTKGGKNGMNDGKFGSSFSCSSCEIPSSAFLILCCILSLRTCKTKIYIVDKQRIPQRVKCSNGTNLNFQSILCIKLGKSTKKEINIILIQYNFLSKEDRCNSHTLSRQLFVEYYYYQSLKHNCKTWQEKWIASSFITYFTLSISL